MTQLDSQSENPKQIPQYLLPYENLDKVHKASIELAARMIEILKAEASEFYESQKSIIDKDGDTHYRITYMIAWTGRFPEVKAKLVRLYMDFAKQYYQPQQKHERMVNILAYSRAANLDLPEYDEKFVEEQYQAAKNENDLLQAWDIAKLIKNDKGKMLKNADEISDEKWTAQEAEDFKALVEELIDLEPEDVNQRGLLHWKIEPMIDWLRLRGGMDDLKMKLCRKLNQLDLEFYGLYRALKNAERADMPAEYIKKLKETHGTPTKVVGLWRKVKNVLKGSQESN